MVGIKGLRSRVRRLEPQRPFAARRIGSMAKFEAEIKAGIEEGRYCPVDMPAVLDCIRQWAGEEPDLRTSAKP